MSVRMNVTLNGELSGLDGLTERLTAAAAEGMRAGLLPMERTAKPNAENRQYVPQGWD